MLSGCRSPSYISLDVLPNLLAFIYFIRGNLIFWKNIFCRFRWASKTPSILSSYKRCTRTPWLKFEISCIDFKSFVVMHENKRKFMYFFVFQRICGQNYSRSNKLVVQMESKDYSKHLYISRRRRRKRLCWGSHKSVLHAQHASFSRTPCGFFSLFLLILHALS